MGRRSGWMAGAVLLGALATASGAREARLVAQLGHQQWPVTSVAVSANGRWVATASEHEALPAMLWDAATGRLLREFRGHTGAILDVDFSPDDRWLVTASDDRTARVWEIADGRQLREFRTEIGGINAARFSPDGKRVATAGWTVTVWEVSSGRVLRSFGEAFDVAYALDWSPDGKRLLTGHVDGTARLWDTAEGKPIREFAGHNKPVTSVAFSPGGGRVATAAENEDGGATIWDAASGRKLLVRGGTAVAFSPDGAWLLTGSTGLEDHTARLWDTRTGRAGAKLAGHTAPVSAVAFCADGRHVLTAGWDGTARMWRGGESRQAPIAGWDYTVRTWRAACGEEVQQFAGLADDASCAAVSADGRRLLLHDSHAVWWLDAASGRVTPLVRLEALLTRVALSPDGKKLATGTLTGGLALWDAESGAAIRELPGHEDSVYAVAFLAGGARLVTAGADETVRVWDAESGEEVWKVQAPGADRLSISPEGRWILGCTGERIRDGGLPLVHRRVATVWEAASGEVVRRLGSGEPQMYVATFSPDGRWILAGDGDDAVRMFAADSGREVRRFAGPEGMINNLGLTPDGRRLVTSNYRGEVAVWDAASGERTGRLETDSFLYGRMRFSPDGRWLWAGSNGTLGLWEVGSGKRRCRLISFRDGTWAVVDDAGRYDAARGGDVGGLHWVIGNEPIALDQLKERYYEPGLLAKVLGFNEEPLRDVSAFEDPQLYPAVELSDLRGEKEVLEIRLKNRGGGIGRVVVKLNGKELTADARGPDFDPEAAEATLKVHLAGDPRVKPGAENRVEVLAYNREGYLRSRGLESLFEAPGAEEARPRLWAVVAGVSDYRGEQIDLRYAAKDAADFARAVRLAAETLFGPEEVKLTVLTTLAEEAQRHPTRENLVRALEAAQESRPEDVLVVYLAGHGVNYGGQEGDFYYLTADAGSGNLADPEVRKRAAISSRELTELVKRIPALKQVLVLDTCASGRFIEKLTEKRNVPSSQIRALERIKDRTGLYILAGCAADRPSYEASRYAQGLLTYSLLLGMRGAALREGEFVDVGTLFGFAADTVPELARDIGGIQRPVVASPRGGASFDIGRLTSADKGRVPLERVRPLVLRSNFQEQRRFRDVLGLARRVDARLRDASARGRAAPLVFVDAQEFPEAWFLAGRYRVNGDEVAVEVNLFRGEAEAGAFLVQGKRDDLEGLAEAIVKETRARLRAE